MCLWRAKLPHIVRFIANNLLQTFLLSSSVALSWIALTCCKMSTVEPSHLNSLLVTRLRLTVNFKCFCRISCLKGTMSRILSIFLCAAETRHFLNVKQFLEQAISPETALFCPWILSAANNIVGHCRQIILLGVGPSSSSHSKRLSCCVPAHRHCLRGQLGWMRVFFHSLPNLALLRRYGAQAPCYCPCHGTSESLLESWWWIHGTNESLLESWWHILLKLWIRWCVCVYTQ